MKLPHMIAAVVGLAILAGCATSDYGRITEKLGAYEQRAALARAEIKASTDPVVRVRGYNTLISLTRNELKLAKRINPESNPAYRNRELTIQQARDERAARVQRLEGELADLIKTRDLEVGKTSSTPPPAA
jgi:type IV pilus biogenesis protein CpaD/CtpE